MISRSCILLRRPQRLCMWVLCLCWWWVSFGSYHQTVFVALMMELASYLMVCFNWNFQANRSAAVSTPRNGSFFFQINFHTHIFHYWTACARLRLRLIRRIGNTNIPREIFLEFCREVSPRFSPATYSLLKWNCNNFTQEACNFLTGKDIPNCT